MKAGLLRFFGGTRSRQQLIGFFEFFLEIIDLVSQGGKLMSGAFIFA